MALWPELFDCFTSSPVLPVWGREGLGRLSIRDERYLIDTLQESDEKVRRFAESKRRFESCAKGTAKILTCKRIVGLSTI